MAFLKKKTTLEDSICNNILAVQREIFQMLAGKYCSQFETTYERKWQCPVLFETLELLGPS